MCVDSTMARANAIEKKKHFYFGIVFSCVNKLMLTFLLISLVVCCGSQSRVPIGHPHRLIRRENNLYGFDRIYFEL